mmetsp:Transcript_8253/g.27446  ORF Transcript_8253/g.27446 Transcript_8253/m.27446 type:complete len:296 (-) Transcript_8253:2044-2931(-)
MSARVHRASACARARDCVLGRGVRALAHDPAQRRCASMAALRMGRPTSIALSRRRRGCGGGVYARAPRAQDEAVAGTPRRTPARRPAQQRPLRAPRPELLARQSTRGQRQAPRAGPTPHAPQKRGPPSPHLLPDDKDAGFDRGLHGVPQVPLSAPGRVLRGERTPRDGARVPEHDGALCVSALDARRRARDQSHRRRYRHLLRERLEPDDGPSGDGSRAPARADEGRDCVPPGVQAHHRGEDSAARGAEEHGAAACHDGQQPRRGKPRLERGERRKRYAARRCRGAAPRRRRRQR